MLIAVQIPAIQTFIVKKVIENFNENKHTNIQLAYFKLRGLSELTLEKLYVPDERGDTLIYAGSLNVKLNKIALTENRFSLFTVNLDRAKFFLHYDSTGSNLAFFLAKFASTEPKDSTEKTKPISLICNNLNITNSTFNYRIDTAKLTPNRFNPSCFSIKNINLALEEIYITKDISLKLKNLQAVENSGLAIENFTAGAIINDTSVVVSEIQLKTALGSMVNWNSLALEFTDWKSFNKFNAEVNLLLNADSISEIQLSDIRYFVPEVKDFEASAKFSGILSGTVSDFSVKKLFISTGKNTAMSASISATGLPKIEETFLYFDINNLTLSPTDVQELNIPKQYKAYLKLPKEIQRLGNLAI